MKILKTLSRNKLSVILIFVSIILLCSSLWSLVHAESLRDVTVKWDMESTTDLAGFDLRINGDNSTVINVEADVRTWAGSLLLLDDQNVMEVRSKDLGGQVSDWSDPAYHDPVPGKPRITVIMIQAD